MQSEVLEKANLEVSLLPAPSCFICMLEMQHWPHDCPVLRSRPGSKVQDRILRTEKHLGAERESLVPAEYRKGPTLPMRNIPILSWIRDQISVGLDSLTEGTSNRNLINDTV